MYETRTYEIKTQIDKGVSIGKVSLPALDGREPVSFEIHAVWFKTYPTTTLSSFEIYDVHPDHSDITNLIYKVENESEWYEPLSTPVKGVGKNLWIRVSPTDATIRIRMIIRCTYEVTKDA